MMNQTRNIIVAGMLLVACLIPQSELTAQLFGGGKKEINTEFIPKGSFAGSIMYPEALSKDPNYRVFPREIVTAWGQSELGFDPLLIKQITWLTKTPDSFLEYDSAPPVWAAVLHFEELQPLSGNLIDQLEETTIAGKAAYSGANAYPNPSFVIYDELTVIVGSDEAFIEEMMTTQGSNSLSEQMKNAKVTGQAMAFIDIESIRPQIDELLSQAGELELPPPVAGLLRVPDLADSIEFGVDTDGKLESQLIFHAGSEDEAEELAEIISSTMSFVKAIGLGQLGRQLNQNDPVQMATLQYANRIGEKYEKRMAPQVDGTDVTIEMKEEILLAPYLLAMLQTMDTSAFNPKQARRNQLRQTALAFHNYESAHGRFPPRVLKDENGNALMSGRVGILPFLEQNNLYNELKMDEPWDSPHNIQFTEMGVPSFSATGSSKGVVRFPVFPNSMWDDNNPIEKFQHVTDGTSNTILAIYAPEEAATNWADPTPWQISETDPMSDIFGDRDEVEVVLVDGSSHTFKRENMTNEKLRALLTVNGGEIVSLDD